MNKRKASTYPDYQCMQYKLSIFHNGGDNEAVLKYAVYYYIKSLQYWESLVRLCCIQWTGTVLTQVGEAEPNLLSFTRFYSVGGKLNELFLCSFDSWTENRIFFLSSLPTMASCWREDLFKRRVISKVYFGLEMYGWLNSLYLRR